MRHIGTILSAAALTMLAAPANAHAAAVACGGGVSTGRVAVNGCISAQRGKEGRIYTREITAYVKARNTGPRALNVSYEAFFRVVNGGDWGKLGSGRPYVPAGGAARPPGGGRPARGGGAGGGGVRGHAPARG